MTAVATDLASQRCIESGCGAQYGLNEQLYVCPRCSGLLEIETNAIADADALRSLWQSRLASPDQKDRSGAGDIVGYCRSRTTRRSFLSRRETHPSMMLSARPAIAG